MQGHGPDKFTLMKATQQIAKNILDIEGIVGIGSSPTIKIFVSSPEYANAVPKDMLGKKVQVIVTGPIRALSLRTSEITPVLGGISISNQYITAGTLGVVHDGIILTNAHVIAMDEQANFRDDSVIIQPGKFDKGTRKIGRLLYYVPIRLNDLGADNIIDFAAGSCEVDFLNDEILVSDKNEKIIFSPTDVKEGDVVVKSGRTTGVTSGIVVSESASVKVNYAPNKWAVFHDVIVVKGIDGAFMEGGDSGSFVSKDKKFVGLGFAGNPDTGYAFVSKAKYIIAAMQGKTLGGESYLPLLVAVPFGILGIMAVHHKIASHIPV